MEDGDKGGNVRRRSRLAVFEHVVDNDRKQKRKKLIHRLHSEDSSPSECELVIDEDKKPLKKKSCPLIRLTEEALTLYCEWDDCTEMYDSWDKFNNHLMEHASKQRENFECFWKNCQNEDFESIPHLMQHLSYHGYISKLKNIGLNISERNKLPACRESHDDSVPLTSIGYRCEWEYCSYDFCTIFEFLQHVKIHTKNNPNVAAKKNDIKCCWGGCNAKFSTKTKLTEHVRTHTKEKVVCCASCGRSFANKTKFCDHRKRQLSSELQSYQCSQCLKLFPTERLLRDHMRSHVNHYKCTMCDMTCPKPSILAKHIRYKHVNFKPYKCTRCHKSFVEKYNLKTHLKTHEEKNPLKCRMCDFECRSKVGMDNHYNKKHDSNSLVYECHCCKKKLKRGTYLTAHLTKQHNYHWPSGHSRFRYRKDEDGIYRLQTVRYESLEVTQEMIRSESMPTSAVKQSNSYNLTYDSDKASYVLSVSDKEKVKENVGVDKKKNESNILITINDVDEEGNIVEQKVVESRILPANELNGEVVAVADYNEKVNDNANDKYIKIEKEDEDEYISCDFLRKK